MFSISIEQRVLMKALEYLEPTVGKNTTGQGDNCLSMRTTGNGSVEMYTTNTLEFTKLEAIVAIGGNTQEQAPYVDFKRFKAIIASIPSNEVISLEGQVNDLLINFALKKTPVKLVGCTNGMMALPQSQFPSATMVTLSKEAVREATEDVCSIVTENAATPIYNCMRIFATGMDAEVTALDMTHKRTFVKTWSATGNNPTQEILLEAGKFKKSLKLFEDYNELEFYMNNAMVRVDGTDMVSSYYQKTQGMIMNISYFARRLSGAFPTNISSTFNTLPTEFIEISKEDLTSCFARIKAIEDQASGGLVGFEVNGNSIAVTHTSAYGNIEDSITAENTVSRTFKTVFKYDNLNDIMKVINSNTFELGVLPNHPNNYVVKTKGSKDVMFTVSGMVNAPATP